MEKYFNVFACWFSVIIGVIVSFLGGNDILLKTVISLTIVDMVTGVLSSLYKKRLDSIKCFKGIIKKIFIYITIAVAVILDNLFGNTVPLREVVITFYIVNEGLSVMENIGKVIDYPPKLKEVFNQLSEGRDYGK